MARGGLSTARADMARSMSEVRCDVRFWPARLETGVRFWQNDLLCPERMRALSPEPSGSSDVLRPCPHSDPPYHPTTSTKGDTTNVAVKIRLKRMGKVRTPYYRVVVSDSRNKRDGRSIEEIGTYNPKADPSVIHVVSDRAQYWLSVGAQPTEAVVALLKLTGDWETFTGEKQTRTMAVAEPKRDKAEIFNEALKELHGEPKSEAVTKKKAPKKSDAKVDEPKKVDAKVDAKVDQPKKDDAKVDEPKKDDETNEKKA